MVQHACKFIIPIQKYDKGVVEAENKEANKNLDKKSFLVQSFFETLQYCDEWGKIHISDSFIV
jgi:hypothetical protein